MVKEKRKIRKVRKISKITTDDKNKKIMVPGGPPSRAAGGHGNDGKGRKTLVKQAFRGQKGCHLGPPK